MVCDNATSKIPFVLFREVIQLVNYLKTTRPVQFSLSELKRKNSVFVANIKLV